MVLSVLVKRGWTRSKCGGRLRRRRSELRRLSEHLAKDIGISRAEAEREADRPFWDYDAETKSCMVNRDGTLLRRIGCRSPRVVACSLT